MAANGQGFAKVGINILSLAWPTKDPFLFKAKLLKLNYILQLIGQILQPTFRKDSVIRCLPNQTLENLNPTSLGKFSTKVSN